LFRETIKFQESRCPSTKFCTYQVCVLYIPKCSVFLQSFVHTTKMGYSLRAIHLGLRKLRRDGYFLGNHLFTRSKWAIIHLGLRKLRRNMYFLGNHLFTRPKWAIHLGLRKLRRNVYFLGVEDLAIMCSHNQWVEHLGFPNIFS
jgi:hypothetical protein